MIMVVTVHLQNFEAPGSQAAVLVCAILQVQHWGRCGSLGIALFHSRLLIFPLHFFILSYQDIMHIRTASQRVPNDKQSCVI